MERGELGAGEGAVGYYAADEGLEDGGAEEGAIAKVRVSIISVVPGGLREFVIRKHDSRPTIGSCGISLNA